MTASSFGIVSITRETKTSEFVQHLENGAVMGTRCRKCSTKCFPPRMDCPECRSSDMEWMPIEARGRLVTYTTVHYGPSGFENDTPYTLGILELRDGLKVLGRLKKGIEEHRITIGMELKIVPVRLSGDRITYEFQN